MTGYTPEQLPVLSALARGFATFDHWFCEVPSQTFTNRSFFHAGTASGFVVNTSPAGSFPGSQHRGDALRAPRGQGPHLAGLLRPAQPVSFTGIIHASRLRHRFARTSGPLTSSSRTQAGGSCRPTPSSSRTCCTGTTTCTRHSRPFSRAWPMTRHPRCSAARPCWPGSTTRSAPPSSATGSNAYNTLLMVNFDEHGGTYDHVPPPPAPPPDPAAPPGQRASRSTVRRAGAGHGRLGLDPRADRRDRRVPQHLAARDDARALVTWQAVYRPRRRRARRSPRPVAQRARGRRRTGPRQSRPVSGGSMHHSCRPTPRCVP